MINYRGDGAPFINRLKLHPVLSERTGEMTACLGLVEQSMSPGVMCVLCVVSRTRNTVNPKP